ncbi:MAG: DnaJ domain-containing protein [Bacteroidia bacterium]
MVNLYEILGVDSNATDKEIKRAFRVMAKKYHPDVSKEPNAQAKFNEVYSAYEILGDIDKRSYYDELLIQPTNEYSETESDFYYDESPVYEWREEAYATAKGYGNMSFKDFRNQKIFLHQWSSIPFIEWSINAAVILFLAFAIYVASSAFPFVGTEHELAMKERQVGFGILLSIVCIFLSINTARIQRNNFQIRNDLKQESI